MTIFLGLTWLLFITGYQISLTIKLVFEKIAQIVPFCAIGFKRHHVEVFTVVVFMPEDLKKKETDRKKGQKSQNTNKNNLYLRKQTVRKRERDKKQML